MRALLPCCSSNTPLFLLCFFVLSCSNTLEYAQSIGLTGTGSSSTTSSSSTSNKHDNENISANTSRRVGHLDHWDSITMATYFGLDWETAKPLPTTTSTPTNTQSSSTFDATTATTTTTTTTPEPAGPVDEYTGYDAAVLFYASWCRNCHALAPLWDQIATLTKAGTRKSNVIMSLFDCEKNAKHTELCSAVGVTHYPTMLFVGAGPYVNRETGLEKKFRKKLGIRELKRTTKFKGNWQFGQEIMDWIRVSHGLSRWYRFSRGNVIMRFLRGLFRLPFLSMGGDAEGGVGVGRGKKVPEDTSLPVGVPNSYASTSGGGTGSAATGAGIASSISGSGGSGADASLEVFQLKQQLKETQKKHDEMEQAATHASMLMNVMMLPSSLFDSTTNNTSQEAAAPQPYVDTFAELTTRNAWTVGASNPKNDYMKSCMADLSVDYCSRLSLGLAKNDAFIESLGNLTTVAEIETVFMDEIESIEPFCRKVDACLANDFSTPECQPEKCPFQNEGACRYVGGCMDPDVMKEYESAMEKVDAAGSSSAAAAAGTGSTAKSSSAKTGGWGI